MEVIKNMSQSNAKKMSKGRKKNQKWLSWLDFTSVKTYLNGAINSKKSTIANQSSLEEKISSVNLTNYLRGLELYLAEYCDFAETPSDLIDYYEELRRSNDKEGIAQFKQNIENFIVWLRNEKRLAGYTSQNYQAHVRGFLSWNNVELKFRNYNERSEKAKRKARLSIDFYKEKEIGDKIIGYIKDFNLKLILKWMQISGLGSKELFSLTFKELRYLDWEKEMVKIQQDREKTGIFFSTYVYGDVKRDVMKYVFELNEDVKDNEYIMLEDPESAYHRYEKMFSTAYRNLVSQEYPELIGKKKIFTMHSYRGLFETICRDLRVPKHIENRFVAHQDDRITKAYISEKDLLQNFKLIQEELFGVRESDTRAELEREIIKNLTDAILNKGKRRTIFRRYEHNIENVDEELQQIDEKYSFLAELVISRAREEILEDEKYLIQLKRRLEPLKS